MRDFYQVHWSAFVKIKSVYPLAAIYHRSTIDPALIRHMRLAPDSVL